MLRANSYVRKSSPPLQVSLHQALHYSRHHSPHHSRHPIGVLIVSSPYITCSLTSLDSRYPPDSCASMLYTRSRVYRAVAAGEVADWWLLCLCPSRHTLSYIAESLSPQHSVLSAPGGEDHVASEFVPVAEIGYIIELFIDYVGFDWVLAMSLLMINNLLNPTIQMYSGITCSRVPNGEFYAQRFQKLISLHLLTNCFIKISPRSLFRRLRRNHSWNSLQINAEKLTSEIYVNLLTHPINNAKIKGHLEGASWKGILKMQLDKAYWVSNTNSLVLIIERILCYYSNIKK